jgi:tetratricopeptide (TPR) repeat protein
MVIPMALGWLTWKQSHQYGGDAVHHYQAILQQNPNAWIAYSNWAALLMERDDHAAAVPLLQQALEIHPDYFEAHLNLADAYERLDRMPEALAHHARALALDNDGRRAHNTYGNALLRARQVDEAVPHLEQAIEMAEAEGEPIYTFYVDLARAYFAAGRFEDVVTQVRRARELAGPDYPLPTSDALMSDALVRLGRRDEAEPYLRRAIASVPADALHRFDLARILYDRDEYAEARRLLSDVIRFRPDLLDAYMLLALTEHTDGRLGDARTIALRALEVARQLLPPDAVRGVEGALAPVLTASTDQAR